MAKSVLRELAIESLGCGCQLEDLQPELLEAAVREDITLYQLIRERALLRAGVPTIDALARLVDRLNTAKCLLNQMSHAGEHMLGGDKAA